MVLRINPREARQGRKGVRVLIVLVAALVLGFIAWVVLDYYYLSQGPRNSLSEPGHIPPAPTTQSQQSKPAQ